MRLRLLYLLQDYPIPSETFIRREIEGLRHRGHDLRVWSIRRGCLVAPAPAAGGTPPHPAAIEAAQALPPGPPHPSRFPSAVGSWLAPRIGFPRLWIGALRRRGQWATLVREAGQVDLVHAHFAGLPVDLAALTARMAGRPFTVSVHAQDVFAQSPTRLRRRLRFATAIAACTQTAIDTLRPAGIPPPPVRLIRHGVPLDPFSFSPALGTECILAIGRLVPKKGFDLLIDAYAKLRGAWRPTLPTVPPPLCLIGDGPCRRKLERQAQRAGLSDHVRFAGVASPIEVREHLHRASMLVLPSRRLPNGDRDGLANVLLEALACGTPLITTTAGAACEVLRHGVDAMLVPPEDPAALCRAMRETLDNPDATRQRTQNGRRLVENRFDLHHTLPPLEAFFKAAIRRTARDH